MRWKQKVREEPQLSAPKMAELSMGVSPFRIEQVIRNAKFPHDAIRSQYRHADSAVRAAWADPGRSAEVLHARAAQLRQLPDRAPQLAAAALECLASMDGAGLPKDTVMVPVRPDTVRLTIEGVRVTVQPTVRVVHTQDPTRHGAVMLVYSKTRTLSRVEGARVAQFVFRAMQASGVGAGHTVDRTLCRVIAPFQAVVFVPPRGVVQTEAAIKATGRQVATLWPAVAPR